MRLIGASRPGRTVLLDKDKCAVRRSGALRTTTARVSLHSGRVLCARVKTVHIQIRVHTQASSASAEVMVGEGGDSLTATPERSVTVSRYPALRTRGPLSQAPFAVGLVVAVTVQQRQVDVPVVRPVTIPSTGSEQAPGLLSPPHLHMSHDGGIFVSNEDTRAITE
jgi:hypothetical protein